jgi:hypothetical protein
MSYQGTAAAKRGAPIRWLLLTPTLVVSSSPGLIADTLRPVETPLDALANTAAIVEGTVKETSYTFDSAAGPRTVAPLVDVTTDFGRFEDRTLELATLGGPIDEKQELYIPELPQLTDDTRYLVSSPMWIGFSARWSKAMSSGSRRAHGERTCSSPPAAMRSRA